ncbi:MAG TPA: phosphoadenosine phosphosulfate reductase family protein, partial [Acidobacteriaceae bacterium]
MAVLGFRAAAIRIVSTVWSSKQKALAPERAALQAMEDNEYIAMNIVSQTVSNTLRGVIAGAEAAVHDLLTPEKLNHLQALEAESIFIFREAVAEFARPVMLYSIGKDSSVMLRLAQKAFFPGKIPFPLLHVDTSYKFPEMIAFRDQYTKELGAELIVHRNEDAIAKGANPFDLGTQNCCGLLKTRSLLDAL